VLHVVGFVLSFLCSLDLSPSHLLPVFVSSGVSKSDGPSALRVALVNS
jgi:hypothetical protein